MNTVFFSRLLLLLRFLPVYLREMVLSNLRVAIDVLRPRPQFQPGFLDVDLAGYGPAARWAAACLISMTPGTLALDLEDGSDLLLVHTLYLADATKAKTELQQLIRQALGPPHFPVP